MGAKLRKICISLVRKKPKDIHIACLQEFKLKATKLPPTNYFANYTAVRKDRPDDTDGGGLVREFFPLPLLIHIYNKSTHVLASCEGIDKFCHTLLVIILTRWRWTWPTTKAWPHSLWPSGATNSLVLSSWSIAAVIWAMWMTGGQLFFCVQQLINRVSNLYDMDNKWAT